MWLNELFIWQLNHKVWAAANILLVKKNGGTSIKYIYYSILLDWGCPTVHKFTLAHSNSPRPLLYKVWTLCQYLHNFINMDKIIWNSFHIDRDCTFDVQFTIFQNGQQWRGNGKDDGEYGCARVFCLQFMLLFLLWHFFPFFLLHFTTISHPFPLPSQLNWRQCSKEISLWQ